MNTLMWQHPATSRHLRQLAQDTGAAVPAEVADADLPAWINGHSPQLRILPPVSKMLACKDVGVGAMALIDQIAQTVQGLAGDSTATPG
jgi:phosphopantothenoylcysteine decarboxylase